MRKDVMVHREQKFGTNRLQWAGHELVDLTDEEAEMALEAIMKGEFDPTPYGTRHQTISFGPK